MTTQSEPLFDVIDPRPIAASAPYTFFLPSDVEIAALAKGDLVKLIFGYSHDIERWGAERMWVTIEEIDGQNISGVLANEPDEPTTTLAKGATVQFTRDHVVDIVWVNPESAPPPPVYREYWERCLVDSCVLTGEALVEFIYREEPELAKEDDKYPDSGWRVRGQQGNATDEEMEAREVDYVAIGAVLNRDDSWLPFIDMPPGTANT